MKKNKGYFLAEACKNTFIIFDCLSDSTVDESFLAWVHKCLIKENRDDALILVDGHEKNGEFITRMIVYGQDATLGEFCGNGSRACAAYLFSHYKQYDNFAITTKHGKHQLKQYEDNIYSIELSCVLLDINPKFIAKPELFQKDGKFYSIELQGKRFFYLDAIEPHLVIPEKLSDDDLFQLGVYLNKRKDIFPNGINLNSYYVTGDNNLFVKTYERGVQRLTLSCGSGSSSCSNHYMSGNVGKVKVQTPGGPLEITLKEDGFQLKGPAIIGEFISP